MHLTEEKTKKDDILVQISRLALKGSKEDLKIYLSRVVNSNIKKSSDSVWLAIRDLLKDFPEEKSLMRGYNERSTELDNELSNLLHEELYPIDLKIEPIWEDEVDLLLNQFINETKQRDILIKNGLYISRKLLFSGPPGVGKTLAAKWISNKLKLPLYTLSLSTVMNSFLGKTGNNIRNIFNFASSKPCVLFFDEFDSIAKKRNDASELGELKRLVTVLLQEIDNWRGDSIFIAATNHSELLDPAVWRRFDITVDFKNPTRHAIKESIHLYLGNSYKDAIKIIPALEIAMQGRSYSEIEKILYQIRKKALIEQIKITDSIVDWISSTTFLMNKNESLLFAKALIGSNISQRKVSEITGISRDTLRKKIK